MAQTREQLEQRKELLEKQRELLIKRDELSAQTSQVPSIAEETPANIDFLPGRQNVQEKIAGRESIAPRIEETITTPESEVPIPLQIASRIASPLFPKAARAVPELIALAFERGEAGASNALRRIQEDGFDDPASIARDFGEGITGKELTQFGDIFRNIGVPEPLSAVGGGLILVGVTNAVSRGLLRKGSAKLSRALKDRGRFNLVRKADDISAAVDDVSAGFNKEFDNIYRKIGNNPVQRSALDKATFWDDLPERSIRAAKKALGSKATSDINTMKKLKGVLRKQIPKNVQNGKFAATDEQALIMRGMSKLNNIIAEHAGPLADDLKGLNARAVDFYKARRSVSSLIFDANGNAKTSDLPGLFSRESQGKLRILTNFQDKFFPALDKTLKAIDKLNRRARFGEIARNIGIRSTVGVGVGAALSRPITRALGARQ